MSSDNTSLHLRDRQRPRVDFGLDEKLSSDKTCYPNSPAVACRPFRTMDAGHAWEHSLKADYSASFFKARPYLRLVLSSASLNWAARTSSRTGEMMSTFPSVETSSGVSASILRRSSTLRSITRAKLLPCFVSFLIIVAPHCRIVLYIQRITNRVLCQKDSQIRSRASSSASSAR